MAWIDIIVIAVILVFTIVGMVKGFLNTLLSLFSAAASLGVAIWCAKPVSRFLDSIFHLVSGIGGSIASGLSAEITPFASDTSLTELSGSGLKTYLESDGLTFKERIFNLFIEDSATFTSDTQVVEYIGQRLAAIITLIIAAVVVFILLRIAVLLLSKLFNALTKNRAIGGLDRALGMIFGFLKGALLVTVVLAVFYLIANETVYGWVNNSVVTKWVYQRVVELVDWIVNKFDLPAFITGLFPQLTPTSEAPAMIGLL